MGVWALLAASLCTASLLSQPGARSASRRRIPLSAAAAPETPLGGAELNEELRLSVQYLGGPASRQRRVRRSKRQSPEERWRQSSLSYLEGHSRMSSFCSFDSIDLEAAVQLLESDTRWRRFGDKVSIVSYTDVVHCHFSTLNGEERDAFLFPYGSVVLWGFSEEFEMLTMEALLECSCPLSDSAIFPLSGALRLNDDLPAGDNDSLTEAVADSEFMLFRYGSGAPASPIADTSSTWEGCLHTYHALGCDSWPRDRLCSFGDEPCLNRHDDENVDVEGGGELSAIASSRASGTSDAAILGDSDKGAETTQAGISGMATSLGPSRGFARIENNVIILQSADPIEKIAVSFAFAQSAKLAVLEAALDMTIEEVWRLGLCSGPANVERLLSATTKCMCTIYTIQARPVTLDLKRQTSKRGRDIKGGKVRGLPEQLARVGSPNLSLKKIAKLSGRIFLQRNEANLHSNILDCPDFFWEAEDYERVYRRVHRYLDVGDRTSVLNRRLDIVNDLLDSIASQLEIRTGHRLEVIIIALITIEIALEVFKDVALPPAIRWPARILRAFAALRTAA